MKKSFSLWLLLLGILIGINARAQDECNAILTHGLRNIQVAKSTEATVALKYFNHCNKEFKLLDDKQLVTAELEIFGFGAGSGDYSRERKEQRLNEWCQLNRETAMRRTTDYTESQVIYDEAVRAWRDCQQIKNQESIVMSPQLGDGKTVSFNLRYTGGAKSGVRYLGVEADGFTCNEKIYKDGGAIESFDPRKEILITQQGIPITCNRNKPEDVVRGVDRFKYLRRGSIVLKTASKNLQLVFSEEWEPSLPKKESDRLQELIRASEQRLTDLERRLATYDSAISLESGDVVIKGDIKVDKSKWSDEKKEVETPDGVHEWKIQSTDCPEGYYVVGVSVRYGGTCGGKCDPDGAPVRQVKLRCRKL